MSEYLLKYKPYKSNFEFSSKWILTKNPNPEFFFQGVCGGGGRDMNTRAAISFYTKHIGMTSSTES